MEEEGKKARLRTLFLEPHLDAGAFIARFRLAGVRLCRKALDPAAVLKRKIRPGLREAWDQGCGLAHVGNTVSGTGRASVDASRLLAAGESQREQQVFTGGIEDETGRSGEIDRGDPAGASVARENPRTGCTQIRK